MTCTKCFNPIANRNDAVEFFGVLYHARCAPKETKKMKSKHYIKSLHAFLRADVLPTKRSRELQMEYEGAVHDLEEEFLEGMSREDAAAWFVLDQMSLDEGKLLRKFHEGR